MPTASSLSNRRQGVEMLKKPHRLMAGAKKKPRRQLGRRASGMLKQGKNAGGTRAKS